MILTADNSSSPAFDGDLLARYARSGDQQAFSQLVRRHIDWLYATALRLTGDKALAEDVTQGVLLALSRKAPALANRRCLAGWLFEATRYGARTALRAETRRRERESMHARTVTVSEVPPPWDDLKDRLDAAVAHLPASDRQVLSLRYYQHMTHEGVASALGISDEAARKRVTRALKRLRQVLGVAASAPALGAALDKIPTVSAPAHLLQQVLAGTVSTKALLIAKGVSLMALASKLKIAMAVSALTLFSGYLVGNYVFAQAGPGAQPGNASAGGGAGAYSGAIGGAGGSGGGGGANIAGGGGGGGVGRAGGGGGGGGSGAGVVGGGGGGGMSGSGGTLPDGSTYRKVSDGTYEVTFTSKDGATSVAVKDAQGNVLFDGPYTTDDDKAKVPADLAAQINRLAPFASPDAMRRLMGGRNATSVGVSSNGGGGPSRTSITASNDGTSSVLHRTDATHDITFTKTGDNTTLVVKDSAGQVLFNGPYNTEADKAKVPGDFAGKVADLATSLSAGTAGPGGARAGASAGASAGRGANGMP